MRRPAVARRSPCGRAVAALVAALLAVCSPHAFGQAAGEAKVTLPLKDYLQLLDQVRQVEEARALAAATSEPAVSEVVSQSAAVKIEDDTASLSATYVVELRGQPARVVSLPLTGLAWQADITPPGASLVRSGDGLAVASTSGGLFTVSVRATAGLDAAGGVSRLPLAPVVAPVATTEVDLPAELGWTCPGAVVAEDRVASGRRALRLALPRGKAVTLELKREVAGVEAEKALAKTVVVTIVRVGPEGALRHDVVLYEVSRGSLGRLEATVPEGLEVERLASDEGELPPLLEGRRVAVERTARLSGTGYLVITSRPGTADSLALQPVEPAVEVRARYLALATSVAAHAEPAPAAAWSRVDLADLPQAISEASEALDLVAAWRRTPEAAEASLAVTTLPPSRLVDTLISRRDTTTLLTVEGTLLHRDRLTLARSGAALELQLAPGSTLWSSSVNGLAVRPLERNGSTAVPLPLGTQAGATVEVVVVQQRAIPPGRSRVTLTPPEVAAPVLTHQWKLLLPEGNRYRFAGGDLRPAPCGWIGRPGVVGNGTATLQGAVVDEEKKPLPGVTVTLRSGGRGGGRQVQISGADGRFTFDSVPPGRCLLTAELPGFSTVQVKVQATADRLNQVEVPMELAQFAEEVEVTAEAPLVDTSEVSTGQTFATQRPSGGGSGRRAAKPKREPAEVNEMPGVSDAKKDLESLSQGLVGGVRPVPVAIPESGKTLILTAALPPERIAVELEVKGAKEQ